MELAIPPVFLPGPRPDPILGWRGALIPFGADPLGFTLGLYRRHGELAAISRSDPVMLFAFAPEHNKTLLSDSTRFETNLSGNAPMPAGSSAARVSNGLLAMNGDKHRQQRRLMLPSFHRQHVNGYRDAMVEQIERVLSRWAPGETRDIAHEMQELTLGVALKTLFSLDTTPEALTLGRLFKETLEITFSPLEMALPVEIPGTGRYRLLRLAEQIEAHVRALIAQRRALGDDGRQDVLATLIAARDEDGQALSDDELVGQTYTLFAAGHETSSNSLAWTLFLLDQHPAVLAHLHDELAALGGDAPSVEQLMRLPLLDRVVKESLRLMPPASVLVRQSTAPFELGGFALPAGATVFLSPFITHRLPEHWDEPQAFRPERWERIDPSLYAYLPFGAGPRMCIGTTFALMEIKLALAMIVQRFRLALPAGARVDPELRLTLRPRGGLPMQLFAQDRQFRRSPVGGGVGAVIDLGPARAAAAD